MEQPVEQLCYCDVWWCGKYKYFYKKYTINIILVMYQKHNIVNLSVHSALKRLFDSRCVDTPIKSVCNWCISAMLPWKK